MVFQVMKLKKFRFSLLLAFLGIASFHFSTAAGEAAIETGSKGAKIYCYMRKNNNSHEVSWKAAYALIKRQSSSLFKTSPRHGAVMIIEAVVKDPEEYPNCGGYLGDLFNSEKTLDKKNKVEEVTPNKQEIENRYNY